MSAESPLLAVCPFMKKGEPRGADCRAFPYRGNACIMYAILHI